MIYTDDIQLRSIDDRRESWGVTTTTTATNLSQCPLTIRGDPLPLSAALKAYPRSHSL